MKKFLSLVLALVMTMSLVTISAGATDFTDDESIDYQEAIDVISAIGVVSGYSDGSFHPTDSLTRGAAAKIITNLILGPSTASTLVCTTAPFPDVPVGHTFAAAITYCSQNKIINGYPDGSFRPDGTLTGYAFLKMLLGALGYDGTIEGFTGSNWTINVAKLADGIGLTNDLVKDFAGTAAVDRQTACLFAFNTIKSDLVEYDNRITANVGGVDVAIGGSNSAKSVTWDSQSTTQNGTNITNDNIIQFGERYFSRLIRNNKGFQWNAEYADLVDGNSGVDAMGRPATVWTWKGEEVGTYAETPDLTYDGSKKLNAIYSDLKMSNEAEAVYIYLDGELVANSEVARLNTYTDKKGGTEKLTMSRSFDGKLENWTYPNLTQTDSNSTRMGDGTLVEVFRNSLTNEVIIAIQNVYGGKVSSTKAANDKKDDYVIIDLGNNTADGWLMPDYSNGDDFYKGGRNEYETTDFKEDDVVAFTYSERDRSIQDMYKMESVEGTLNKVTTGKSLQLGDTTYKFAKEVSYSEGLTEEDDLSNGSNYIVYQDKTGYALWIEESEFSPDAYALIIRITGEKKNGKVVGSGDGIAEGVENASGVGAWDGNRARLLFADGTTKTVDLDKAYLNTAGTEIHDNYKWNNIVRFRVNANGEYKLSTASGSTKSSTNFKIDSNHNVTGISGVEFDNKTLFVVNENGSYSLVTGIRNAPTVTGGKAYVYADNQNVAKVVFITDGVVVNSSKSLTFLAKESASKLIYKNDGDSYYEYNAVVKGEITTVQVRADQAATSEDGRTNELANHDTGKLPNIVLNQTSYDDELLIFGAYDATAYGTVKTAEGVRKQSGNEIRVGTWQDPTNTGRGTLLTIASGAEIWYVDGDGAIEKIEYADIATAGDVDVMYTLDDGDINNLFIIEVDR